MIRTSQPVFRVTLIKTIRRRNNQSERYSGLGKSLDLTPILDEYSSVITRKNITQPLGSFTITLPDKAIQPEQGAFQDSLYGWIEPMDVIEIRMGRDLYLKDRSTNDIPIVMRGFVSSIRKGAAMAGDGKPIRTIIIDGHDYGKLLNIIQIFYQNAYGIGLDLLTAFKMTTNQDIRFAEFTTAGFIQEVLAKVVNPHLQKLQNDSALDFTPRILPDTAGVKDGIVQPYGFQNYEGTIWTLMRQQSDRFWNELFIEDREDGVYLVCRQMPFKDIDGRYIDDAVAPGHVDIEYKHVDSLSVGRSDHNLANYYWVGAPRSLLNSQSTVQMEAYRVADDFYIKDYPNCDVDLYGIRKMQVNTEQGPGVPGLDEAEHEEAKKTMDTWTNQRVQRLIKFNRDNVLFEDGQATLRGDEAIRAGRYLRFRIGTQKAGYTAEYYCIGVIQELLPLRSWVSRVELIRGTGYIERSKMNGSPYLAERGAGAY